MPQRSPRFECLLPLLVGLAVLTGACSGPVTLQSQSMSEAPSVDGALDEWGGTLPYVGDKPVSMSAVPTDSLLYVAVAIQDRRLIRTVAANGLIVWVDPTGGQKRTYGIQYPLGLRAQGTGQGGASSTASAQSREGSPIEQVDLSTLDVVWADSARRRIPAHFSSGLRAKATLDPGSLVYELAIPVEGAPQGTAGREHGLRASLGETIGIGLQTPEPDEDDSVVTMPKPEVPTVTGRPGRGRPRTGRRRRQPPRRAPSPSPPMLDLWAKVVAAEEK